MKLAIVASLFFAFAVNHGAEAASAGKQPYRHSVYKKPSGRSGKFRQEWTKAVVSLIKQHRSTFESARDVDSYCPGYNSASEDEKNNCWLRLTSGIMSYESNYTENAVGDHGLSCGLMQIQAMNCKADGFQCQDLRQAKNNAKCGVAMMARLIKRDRVIAAEGMEQGRHKARKRRRGLGRGGWSTMMAHQMFTDKITGRTWQVGHRDEIAEGTRSFLDPKKGVLACADESLSLPFGKRILLVSN